MSDTCGNCSCSDKSQCVKKGNNYGVDIVETGKSLLILTDNMILSYLQLTSRLLSWMLQLLSMMESASVVRTVLAPTAPVEIKNKTIVLSYVWACGTMILTIM
ncbi:Metallothionein-like protein [Quillaja saponaria]|uniref:Metallothionein-like protein n=1 Tax=Quillaja saponaria TaxID=32244 RepID=A0AAD7VMQ1_QUISA|nr:Metallothionein-like protein [Quillaja saponaria]